MNIQWDDDVKPKNIQWDDLPTSTPKPESGVVEFGRGIARGAMSLVPSAQTAKTALGIINPAFKPVQDAIVSGVERFGAPGYSEAQAALAEGPKTFGGQVAGGAGYLIPTLVPMGRSLRAIEGLNALKALRGAGVLRSILRPAAGFSGYEGAKTALTSPEEGGRLAGETIKSAIRGAGTGAAFGAAGVPFSRLGRVGQMAGGAAGMALTAPEGERASSAILGAGLGAMGEGKRQELTSQQRSKLRQGSINTMRGILKPTASEVNNLKKQGVNINDVLALIPENNIKIDRVDRDGRPMVDTTKAKSDVNRIMSDTSQELIGEMSATKYKPTFSIDALKDVALKRIGEMDKTAKEINTMKEEAASYFDAEKERYGGDIIDGATAETIKSQLNKVAYNKDKPTSHQAARLGAYAIKDAIEKAYPDVRIKELNTKLHKYSQLKHLLEKAGMGTRVVSGGKLGKYFARMVGGGIGGLVGSLVPIPGVGTLGGAGVGWAAAEGAHRLLTSPAMKSKMAARKYAKGAEPIPTEAKATEAISPKVVIPALSKKTYHQWQERRR